MGPYSTLRNLTWPDGTIWDYAAGQCGTIRDHLEQGWTMRDSAGPCGTMRDHAGPWSHMVVNSKILDRGLELLRQPHLVFIPKSTNSMVSESWYFAEKCQHSKVWFDRILSFIMYGIVTVQCRVGWENTSLGWVVLQRMKVKLIKRVDSISWVDNTNEK